MLPSGFQPRPCRFCGSRYLKNSPEPGGLFKVTCLFCKAFCSLPARSNDEAWLFWSGMGPKAPPSGTPRFPELRPCVFCDSTNIFDEGSRIVCLMCGAHGPDHKASDGKAMVSWNGRGKQAPTMFGSYQEVMV